MVCMHVNIQQVSLRQLTASDTSADLRLCSSSSRGNSIAPDIVPNNTRASALRGQSHSGNSPAALAELRSNLSKENPRCHHKKERILAFDPISIKILLMSSSH